MNPRFSACGALLAAALLLSTPGRSSADVTLHQITSDPGDGEARQSSAGDYTVATGTPVTHLRVGFQSSFGSTGQPAGGLNAVWFFKLPLLDTASGQTVVSADFVTTLLEESSTTPITPRFNADLYALGFSAAAAATADGIHFFAGPDQTGDGLGHGQQIQKVDDNFFTVFTDWESVNTPFPKLPKSVATDTAGKDALLAYIQSVYANPAFPNTGNEFLVLRLSADRAASETYEENGTQFYGKGTTRYRVANSESAGLTSTDAIDYINVIPTRLTLGIDQPAPAVPFRISNVQYQAETGQVSLTWPSVPGKTYTVSSSSDLSVFQPVNGSVPADSVNPETTFSFQFPPPSGTTRMFFRVARNP